MKAPIVTLIVVALFFAGFFWWDFFTKHKLMNSLPNPAGKVVKPLNKYAYESLFKTHFKPSEITIGRLLSPGSNFESHIFYFYVGGERVSGLINIPSGGENLPVIVLFRGFVDPAKYTTGEGTQHDGEYFAQNGYITLAPDFLGYGESDKASIDAFEDRFQTYTTSMTLLSSVVNLNKALQAGKYEVSADASKVGIWGHSNGGQIAISTLEISAKPYPTVLWAPVSKPFPYSILYYTDEFDDKGKALRASLAKFEKDYDAEKFSPANYFGRITAPLQVDQGLSDIEVPPWWSSDFVSKLKSLGRDVEYNTFPGEDHNFDQGSWSSAIVASLHFFNSHLK